MTEIDSGRAAFQVLVFPFRREGDGFVYALFRRQDAGYWQGVAGGGEAGESPLEAARRETMEEAGISGGEEFVVLDARATMPVVAVTGDFSWGPQVLVIPEYAFGVGVEDAELRLSDEHTEYGWFGFEEACTALRWDSNRTALWELDHRLRHGPLADGAWRSTGLRLPRRRAAMILRCGDNHSARSRALSAPAVEESGQPG